MNEKEVLKEVKTQAEADVNYYEKEIKNLKKVIKYLEVKNYSVYIHNFWNDYPEQKDHFGNGKDLRKTFNRVINKFMKINERTDVQGEITTYINMNPKYHKLLYKGSPEGAKQFIREWED